jgi:hypothetical protein
MTAGALVLLVALGSSSAFRPSPRTSTTTPARRSAGLHFQDRPSTATSTAELGKSYGIPMEFLWNPYGTPMEHHARLAKATGWQLASSTPSNLFIPSTRLAFGVSTIRWK